MRGLHQPVVTTDGCRTDRRSGPPDGPAPGARRRIRCLAGLLPLLAALATVAMPPLPASAGGPLSLEPDWSQLSPSTNPGAIDGASMAYDPATGNMVLYGGTTSAGPLDNTWTWNGSDWTELSPATNPGAIDGASMAYDPATGNMVLYGGTTSAGPLDNTWTWNGSDWTELSPATNPGAIDGASMAYDPATGNMVLFGGTTSAGPLDNTWTWNGSDWTELSPATNPGAIDGASMAYDPATGNMVLYGGTTSAGPLDNTWTWNGSDWTELSPATNPGAIDGASMAYDPATGNMVLFGGTTSAGPLDNTWTWNGSDWVAASAPPGPSARESAAMADDAASGALVLFGGDATGGQSDQTWAWAMPAGEQLDWNEQSAAGGPPARNSAAMAFDPATANTVLFGGFGNSGVLGDTWTHAGDNWIAQSPATSPSARDGASMAYDPATGQMVLFGGFGAGGPLNDTWIWSGSDWSARSPATSPPARYYASMAFDPASGDLVLFGGSNPSGDLADTWTWNGSTWSEQFPTTSPSARNGAAMAYDPASATMVLFSGDDSLGDTWTWSGTDWTPLAPAASPPQLAYASMAFDPASGDLVLFGGLGDSGNVDGLWSFDGTTWTSPSPDTSPSARNSASMVEDPSTGDLLLFGGTDVDNDTDTWTLGLVTGAFSITGLDPASGPTSGGTLVVITGTNLTGASAVDFGPAPATGLTVVNSTTIDVTTPPGQIGTVDVSVTVALGTGVDQDAFTYVPPPPTIASLSPASGTSLGGTTVTITGTNLAQASAVDFGASAATVTSDDASALVVTTPSGSDGAVAVSVTTPGGTTTDAAAFTYLVTSVPSYSALAPIRICDTRAGNPSGLRGDQAQCNGSDGQGSRLAAGRALDVDVAGHFGVPADATAVVLNVTAINAAGQGYLTVYPAGQAAPTASNLNFTAVASVPNLVEAGLGTGGTTAGQVAVVANTAVDVAVDLEGFVSPLTTGAGLYRPLASPARICDTRAGNPSGLSGGAQQCTGHRLGTGGTQSVTVGGLGGVPASGVSAVVLNVTVIGPAAKGYLSVYPAGQGAPTASNLNFRAGETVANRIMVPLSADGAIDLTASQGTDALVDVSGWYSEAAGTGSSYTPLAAPVRVCDTRPSNPSGLSGPNAQCNGVGGAGAALGPVTTLNVTVSDLDTIPSDATAVVLNLTAIQPSAQTYLSVYPGPTQPLVSDLNPAPGTVVANLVVATVSATRQIIIYNHSGTANLAVDIAGYYAFAG